MNLSAITHLKVTILNSTARPRSAETSCSCAATSSSIALGDKERPDFQSKQELLRIAFEENIENVKFSEN